MLGLLGLLAQQLTCATHSNIHTSPHLTSPSLASPRLWACFISDYRRDFMHVGLFDVWSVENTF